MSHARRALAALAAVGLYLPQAPAHAAACPQGSQPVCAADGATYPDPCAASAAGTSVAYAGSCLSLPVGDAAKLDRVADAFLARTFLGTHDLSQKVRGYAATLARLDAVAAGPGLSRSASAGLARVRARYAQKGLKLLQAHFRIFAENWFRANLAQVAPQPGVDDKFAVTRFSWGPVRLDGTRLYAAADVAYESRLEGLSSSFDVAFDGGKVRVLPVLARGVETSLRPGVLARVAGSDVLFRVTAFVDSPCPAGAWCFWSGQSVEAAWYRAGQARRAVDGGEAFGYRLQIVESDYKTYARVKVWPSQWN